MKTIPALLRGLHVINGFLSHWFQRQEDCELGFLILEFPFFLCSGVSFWVRRNLSPVDDSSESPIQERQRESLAPEFIVVAIVVEHRKIELRRDKRLSSDAATCNRGAPTLSLLCSVARDRQCWGAGASGHLGRTHG